MLYSHLRLGPLSPELKTSTFRKSAIGLTAAAMLFGTAGGAFGQQISRATQELTRRVMNDPAITTQTNCAEYKKNMGYEYGVDALCEVRKGQLLEQQGKSLDRERASEAQLKTCLRVLQGFQTTNPADFAKLGKVTRENACDLAGRVSRPTAALN